MILLDCLWHYDNRVYGKTFICHIYTVFPLIKRVRNTIELQSYGVSHTLYYIMLHYVICYDITLYYIILYDYIIYYDIKLDYLISYYML